MEEVRKILTDRPSKHGEFSENSRATWEALAVFQRERNWPTLDSGKKHAIYMILHKIARAMVGDPDEIEHWDDVAGYATCVADRLRSPVVPYDGDDVYSTLARGWSCTRDEAKKRAHGLVYQARSRSAASRPAPLSARKTPLTERDYDWPAGTPDDGGQHSRTSADAAKNIDQVLDGLERELSTDGKSQGTGGPKWPDKARRNGED